MLSTKSGNKLEVSFSTNTPLRDSASGVPYQVEEENHRFTTMGVLSLGTMMGTPRMAACIQQVFLEYLHHARYYFYLGTGRDLGNALVQPPHHPAF